MQKYCGKTSIFVYRNTVKVVHECVSVCARTRACVCVSAHSCGQQTDSNLHRLLSQLADSHDSTFVPKETLISLSKQKCTLQSDLFRSSLVSFTLCLFETCSSHSAYQSTCRLSVASNSHMKIIYWAHIVPISVRLKGFWICKHHNFLYPIITHTPTVCEPMTGLDFLRCLGDHCLIASPFTPILFHSFPPYSQVVQLTSPSLPSSSKSSLSVAWVVFSYLTAIRCKKRYSNKAINQFYHHCRTECK